MGIITKGMGAVIKKMKPNVPKTKLDQVRSDLAKMVQKTKGSAAKLKQTHFEIKNPKFKGKDFTFATSKKKTMSNTEKAKLWNEESKKMFKKTMGDNKKIIKKIFKGDK